MFLILYTFSQIPRLQDPLDQIFPSFDFKARTPAPKNGQTINSSTNKSSCLSQDKANRRPNLVNWSFDSTEQPLDEFFEKKTSDDQEYSKAFSKSYSGSRRDRSRLESLTGESELGWKSSVSMSSLPVTSESAERVSTALYRGTGSADSHAINNNNNYNNIVLPIITGRRISQPTQESITEKLKYLPNRIYKKSL